MGEQEAELNSIINVLDKAQALPYVLLVGSWVEIVYAKAGLLRSFKANIRTLDVDFLIPNMRKPSQPVNVCAIARKNGFLIMTDRLNGTTKIKTPGGLDVEFLIGKRGAGAEHALKTNIGVCAQSLWHMDILVRSAVRVGYEGREIVVPSPAGYVTQKMVINHERGRKARKDAQAVINLMPYLDQHELCNQFRLLTAKEKRYVNEFMKQHGLDFA